MLTGTIFDIKEFAVFDGPGMRQTVFFKGCPLRCNWCHNPEGLCMQPQLMVSHASCTDCGRCRAVCQHETCIACGACVAVCPLRLRKIAGEAVSSEELVRRIRKNASYYARYGGGVTFSGGEPFMQHAFLLEVLKQIPDLHRAIETSGYCEPAVFAEVIRHVDYVMMDLKIMNNEAHKRYTGVSNRQILENAKALIESGIPFEFRTPLIPKITYTEENLAAIKEFIGDSKWEQLPYNTLAGAKYPMLNRDYPYDPESIL